MKNTLIAFFLLALVACKNDPATTADNAADTSVRMENVVKNDEGPAAADTLHNAQNSLDVAGTYKGILPCADCEGIATTLSINADKTYEMSVEYMGKKDKLGSSSKGNYRWNDGNVLVLDEIKNAPSMYKAGENTLTQLDIDGKQITGANAAKYVLAKQ